MTGLSLLRSYVRITTTMKRLLLLLVIAIFIAAVALPSAAAAQPPLVLAFYYDWYDANTWKPNRVADLPATPYASSDPAAMARQIQQARGAGIDAFVVSWWGAGNPTDTNLATLLDQARAANFQIAVDFEVTSPFYNSKTAVINSLKNLLATRAQHPAYLRVNGKPVIFFWREQRFTPDEWNDIRNTVDPNHQSLWIAEGVKEQLPYLNVFDGFHLYSIAWAPDVAAELQKWSPRVRSYGADKIWVATVMPGADNSKSPEAGKVIRDRRNGDFYRETWRAAFSTNPDWIIITSWNEWVEGTMIEPSVTYGNLYLDITRGFAAQFKAGLPTPTPTLPSTPTAPVTSTASIDIPGAITATVNATDTLRVRADPSTDAAILGRLRLGTTVMILARSDDSQWWQIAYPDATQVGWVAAEYVTVTGSADSVPVVSPTATPTPAPTDTTTPTDTPAPTDTPVPTSTLAPTLEPPTPTPTPTASNLLQNILGWLPFH